jgi:predicted house-cleaning noncanonical NTP pyrophosphatase (MazG superfamily)
MITSEELKTILENKLNTEIVELTQYEGTDEELFAYKEGRINAIKEILQLLL